MPPEVTIIKKTITNTRIQTTSLLKIIIGIDIYTSLIFWGTMVSEVLSPPPNRFKPGKAQNPNQEQPSKVKIKTLRSTIKK